MKKPSTVNEFMDLLKSMQHRERFVFELLDSEKSEYRESLEVYSTFPAWSIGDGLKHNINYQFVDVSGKNHTVGNKYHKNTSKTSQLLSVTRLDWLKGIFNVLK